MVQTRSNWKCVFFSFIIVINVFVKCLPADKPIYSFSNIDTVFGNTKVGNNNVTNVEETVNANQGLLNRNSIRPGQTVTSYAIELTVKEDSFEGRAIIGITLSRDTREDDMVLQIDGLDIHAVKVGVLSSANAVYVDFEVDQDLQQLKFSTFGQTTNYVVIVEYSGQLANNGYGLYRARYNQHSYVAMNLYPTYARRVFPCIDEPSEAAVISFTFKNLDYTYLETNSLSNDGGEPQFRPLFGPPHRWGMIAHNFVNLNIVNTNVFLFGRPGACNQDVISALAINSFYNNLNKWTNKPFSEINVNQNDRMNIIALPDVSSDWHALSIVGIWEPYVFMEKLNSMKQRSIALPKIAEAMAKQWFGYTIYAENWRYEWLVQGLASYAGWEVLRMFQGDGTGVTMLDVNTLFVTEVIQESLLRDSYATSGVLETEDELFDEAAIRDHIGVNGIIKYKAPALMRMMRIVLGDANTDYIQLAGSLLLNHVVLEAISTSTFLDAVTSLWNPKWNFDFEEYLEPWIYNNGYPLLRVSRIRGSGVLLSQEIFGFSNKAAYPAWIPLTYTTSVERNFNVEKIYPVTMIEENIRLSLSLDDEDWVIFNIQGQGYYRVTYDIDLWENIIKALENPGKRQQIHPLNRATLVDDALNIARAGRLDYDIAFRVVLSMEHETEYAVWKAFVRNMNFLKKRLLAYVHYDEDLPQDIYLKIVQKTIRAFEERIGFEPDVTIFDPAMQSLTRGLVMDHACRANYQPCIAVAKKIFFDPHNNKVVNLNIPQEIRPAVYCTMVREGDENVIKALKRRLEMEPAHYERLVILESLGCSRDRAFINRLLDETIAADSPYGMEERVKIFAAVAESSFANADLARAFLSLRTSEIREMYGGPEKLEEVIFILAENMADEKQSEQFQIWVNSQNNNLEDSQDAALRALNQVQENLVWNERDMRYVFELILNMLYAVDI